MRSQVCVDDCRRVRLQSYIVSSSCAHIHVMVKIMIIIDCWVWLTIRLFRYECFDRSQLFLPQLSVDGPLLPLSRFPCTKHTVAICAARACCRLVMLVFKLQTPGR